MVKKNEYFYPDIDDFNLNLFMYSKEPYPNYWQNSEKRVLMVFDKLIQEKKPKKMLDVGCGDGRLLERYAKHFEEIIALEPDTERLKRAKERLKKYKHIKFVNSTFLEYKSKQKFDMILCSHVLQFITTPNLPNFIKRLHQLLTIKGHLILLTSHSKKRKSYFARRHMSLGKLVKKEISENKFNKLRINNKNILPIHFFSISDIKKKLTNFKIKQVKVYHILYKKTIVDKYFFRDNVVNIPLVRRVHGEDLFIIAKKNLL